MSFLINSESSPEGEEVGKDNVPIPPRPPDEIKRMKRHRSLSSHESPLRPLASSSSSTIFSSFLPKGIKNAIPFLPELFVSCQAGTPINKGTKPTNLPADFQFDLDQCKKYDFLKLLKPKKGVKISDYNPSCCPFGPPGSKHGLKFPICSWFASPKYYTDCSRSTRLQCCKTKCWYYCEKHLDLGSIPTENTAEETTGQDEQHKVVRPRLSSNTLHGVKSVNDLRAWSICCEEQRRYFLEQLANPTIKSKGEQGSDNAEGMEGVMDEDAPDGASAMEMKYEDLLKMKDDEIERLKARIRELEGLPKRTSPSSLRPPPADSTMDTSKAPSESGVASNVTVTDEESPEPADGKESLANTESKPVTDTDSATSKVAKDPSELSSQEEAADPTELEDTESVVEVTSKTSPLKGKSSSKVNVEPSSQSIASRASSISKVSGTPSPSASPKTSGSLKEKSKSRVSVASSKSKSRIPSSVPSKTSRKSKTPTESKDSLPTRTSDYGSLDEENTSKESINPSESNSKSQIQSPVPSKSKSQIQSTVPSKSKSQIQSPVPSKSKSEIQSTVPSKSKSEIQSPVPSKSKSEIQSPVPSKSKSEIQSPVPSKSKSEIQSTVPSKSKSEIQSPVPSNESAVAKTSDTGSQTGDTPEEETDLSPKESVAPAQSAAESVAPTESTIPDDTVEITESSTVVESLSPAQSTPESVAPTDSTTLSPKESKRDDNPLESPSEAVAPTDSTSGESPKPSQAESVASSVLGAPEDADEIIPTESVTSKQSNVPSKLPSKTGSVPPSGSATSMMSDVSLESVKSVVSVIEKSSQPSPDSLEAAQSLRAVEPTEDTVAESSATDVLDAANSLGAVEPVDAAESSAATDLPLEKARSFGAVEPLEGIESAAESFGAVEPLETAEPSPLAESMSAAKSLGVLEPAPAAESMAAAQESPASTGLRTKSTRTRSLSLAEIGPPEKRPNPLMCSCDESRTRKFPHTSRTPALAPAPEEMYVTLADLNLGLYNLGNPYDTKVVVENNKIVKMHGLQVVEALEPESLVADYDFLREKVAAQRQRINDLECTLYSVNPPTNMDQNEAILLQQQVTALKVALCEQQSYSANWYSALQTTTRERNDYRDEAARNEVLLREYELAVIQMQQRIRVLENGVGCFQTRPHPQQQCNYPYYNNTPAPMGRGDPSNTYNLYHLP